MQIDYSLNLNAIEDHKLSFNNIQLTFFFSAALVIAYIMETYGMVYRSV